MHNVSEMLKDLDISGFRRTGIFKDDVNRFCDYAHVQTDNPYLIALRLAFGDTVTVHTLTGGVCNKIRNTSIEHLPNGRPEFLKKPFLLEAKGETLLHTIHTIGGYIDNGVLIIISYFIDGSFLVQREQNSFSGMAIEDINFRNSTGEEPAGDKKNRDTLPFITVLALMLEAERTPLSVDGGSRKSKKRSRDKRENNSSGWVERRIYINAAYLRKTNADGQHVFLDKEGKQLKNVHIQGFLRNQPYGPQHKLRKWIYVEGFESSRWTYGKDTRITVAIKE
ncbi:MAG: hypothetical protein LBP76_04025 [Treponema sp.]|jgi:hypothetical protein|nr:hypothetical protein [Treponema sp.]